MIFKEPLIAATFRQRPNRYIVHATLCEGERAGAEVMAHCADPGRLTELLQPGATLFLSRAVTASPTRKTSWDLRLVRDPEIGTLVSLDTRVPNRVFEEGLRTGFFPHFAGWTDLARECPLPLLVAPPPTNSTDRIVLQKAPPHSRIDFLLGFADGARTWLEVKSASLVVEREARFPDAVTDRGRRHLLELAELVRRGERAAVVFIVQREDVDHIVAHRATDPDFADALDIARSAGVTFLAATCKVTLDGIALDRLVPVL